MDAAIEKVIETYGMMRSLTSSEMTIMRKELTSHLAEQTGHTDHDLIVEGLSFLRRLSESTARFKRRTMSTNKPPPDGHRVGAVKDRSQLKTRIEGEEHWTKRDKNTGQFMDQKADDEKFKGVRKE